jgi:dihydrofolate synthase/folylpolyglutamate synthase
MTFDQALKLWFSRVNYEQRAARPSDLKLDRMRALLELLGDPHRRLRVIHVAGSKGKGSVAAMLEAILRSAGYRTGLFTSPHLCRVEERLQVDGAPIQQDELAALMEEVDAAARTLERKQPAGSQGVTFFEVATALGFLHFLRRRVEVAVLEVGLGGRFDSTNVCQPLVALITSISYDHTEQLGSTLRRIAGEKAGIVKNGRPAVSGARGSEARAVIEQVCRDRNSPLHELDTDFSYRYEPGVVVPGSWRAPGVWVRTGRRVWPRLELGLLGEHQAANAAVVVAAVEELKALGFLVEDRAVAAGLATVSWPARLEVIGQRPLVVLDCAHNLASAQALVDTVEVSFPSHRLARAPGAGPRRLLLFGGSTDKDLEGMLKLLAPHFSQAYLTRFGSNPRAATPELLADMWRRVSSLPCITYPTAPEGWRQIRQDAREEDLLCITGSVFLAGELRPLLLPAGSGSA